jgi:hypothetical protein
MSWTTAVCGGWTTLLVLDTGTGQTEARDLLGVTISPRPYRCGI